MLCRGSVIVYVESLLTSGLNLFLRLIVLNGATVRQKPNLGGDELWPCYNLAYRAANPGLERNWLKKHYGDELRLLKTYRLSIYKDKDEGYCACNNIE